ncbi:MAG: hypothetical protein LKJ76_10095 [Lachnospiraceae bacterium]|jgi:flagellar basal body-associated protein FliL|nr:hypothetical protein [Lachnospiraceae bacterium]
MNVNRAFTKKEKIIVLVVILALLVITGLTRPLWSRQGNSAAGAADAATTEQASGTAVSE